MARLAGITLPKDKRIEIALTYIYGIGLPTSQKILKQVGVDANKRTHDLTPSEVNSLREIIEKGIKVEGELRSEIYASIKRLKEISTYRGYRHSRNLPVRGQRTKTNSRTVRGNVRRTMLSGRKKSDQKT